MNYILFSVCTAAFFAATFLFRKLATKTLSIQTAFFVEALTQIILLSMIFAFLSPELKKGLDLNNKGYLFALCSGLFVVLGVGANYLAVRTGTLSKVVSITSPTQIVIGVLLGIIIFGDGLSLKQISGIILAGLGVILITS